MKRSAPPDLGSAAKQVAALAVQVTATASVIARPSSWRRLFEFVGPVAFGFVATFVLFMIFTQYVLPYSVRYVLPHAQISRGLQ